MCPAPGKREIKISPTPRLLYKDGTCPTKGLRLHTGKSILSRSSASHFKAVWLIFYGAGPATPPPHSPPSWPRTAGSPENEHELWGLPPGHPTGEGQPRPWCSSGQPQSGLAPWGWHLAVAASWPFPMTPALDRARTESVLWTRCSKSGCRPPRAGEGGSRSDAHWL